MPLGMVHGEDLSLRSTEFLESLALVNQGRPAQLLSSLRGYFPINGQGNTVVCRRHRRCAM
jgi:hypothetical protein